MSNMSNGITGSAASVIAATQYSANDMGPDATLAYCAYQLNGIDSEMATQMNDQNLQLAQREAVENAQDALESFGTTGPQTPQQFQTCENAINAAAASLPPGDPVAAQLSQFGSQIAQQYGYTAPEPLTPAQMAEVKGVDPVVIVNSDGSMTSLPFASQTVQGLVNANNGALTKAPANNDWQGTTDTLGSLSNSIQSNASLQMMTIQNLASQQQTAVQIATGMMSTENETLQDIAKNIGS